MLLKSTATSKCLVTNIIQNIFFCVQQLDEIHTRYTAGETSVNILHKKQFKNDFQTEHPLEETKADQMSISEQKWLKS